MWHKSIQKELMEITMSWCTRPKERLKTDRGRRQLWKPYAPHGKKRMRYKPDRLEGAAPKHNTYKLRGMVNITHIYLDVNYYNKLQTR